jgi:hypothetical protein
MHRSAIVFALYLSFALALGAACGQPAEPETPGDDAFTPNSGGTKSSGGSGGSSGGAGGAGGTTGGTTGGGFSGGTGGSATGGAGGGTGGSVMGGAGRANTGGTTGGSTTGGGAGTVGTTGGTSGGMGSATGGMGTVGMAGQSGVSCDAAFAVGMDGFVRMPGAKGGCYSGYAFAGGDATSTVTFPGGGTDFTKAMGVLNITGTVGAAVDPDYLGNVYFGFNIGQKVGGTNMAVVPTGTGITVTCTGCATPAMRAQLVKGSTQWCAPLTSGTAIPYTSFKKECWEGGAMTAYAMEAIESIQISIPGAAADATFDVTLTSVKEN